ncbi:MAG: hypothetical protein C7B47_01575 [Sulfobacillus thermosulfidooxidans]|uniref:Uncharacterized protein n=1 Tax=Sulfobacillus thermosulfidooxidans TaxID=28034 RepID=A0A2T2X4L9_SULTH|nr:MAG: hypothetical protein C7B47_01575 [Sulfobacillus thermosulfidooxidans]
MCPPPPIIDHIGASRLFRTAEKWIHNYDSDRLSDEQATEFNKLGSDVGGLYGLSYLLLGHHTKGSVVLYDVTTHCLFCGDYICFFGNKVAHNNFLTFGEDLRDKTRAFVTAWSQSPENRHKYQFEMFVHELKLLSSYKEAMYLATGHGSILHHHIVDFINELGSIDN